MRSQGDEAGASQTLPSYDDIADLIGSVKGLPPDLSRNKKKYLRAGYDLNGLAEDC